MIQLTILYSNGYFQKGKMMKRINLLCPTILRQSRKIGRNEPCPCGRTKEVADTAAMKDVFSVADDGATVAMKVKQVPIKFKHCHGDTDNMKKANKIQNYLRKHFVDILNKPRKVSKLQTLATKFKSLFNKNRSK
jgi:hypothetical protein